MKESGVSIEEEEVLDKVVVVVGKDIIVGEETVEKENNDREKGEEVSDKVVVENDRIVGEETAEKENKDGERRRKRGNR